MRKVFFALLTISLIFTGCSAYKEISPNPEINPAIDGYKKIIDKKENFELEKGKKYYLVFKKPSRPNVYLMIKNNIKPYSEYYFTGKFLKETGYKKIADLTPDEKNLSVFPLDTLHKNFYWVIEKINKDTLLYAKYRYIDAWRFGFERDYQNEKRNFEKYKVDRRIYDKVDISQKLTKMVKHLSLLKSSFDSLTFIKKRVEDLERYFPDEYRSSKDKDYKKYLLFANDVEEEFNYQRRTLELLTVLTKLKESENQPELFLENVGNFDKFLFGNNAVDKNLKNKIKEIISSRLNDIEDYYEKIILKKIDAEPFNITPPLSEVKNLFAKVYGFVPQKIAEYELFFKLFDKQANLLKEFLGSQSKLGAYLRKTPKWLPNRFFDKALEIISEMGKNLPEVHPTDFRNFKSYTCVNILYEKAKSLKRKLRKLEREFKESKYAVIQINNYKANDNIGEIISLLRSNKTLEFLRNHYSFLDKEFLRSEVKKIDDFLNTKIWSKAENELKKLFEFQNFIKPNKIKAVRDSLVIERTNRLYKLVYLYTKNKIDSVLKLGIGAYENLDSLYSQKNFSPVYVLSFDPQNRGLANDRNLEISKYIVEKQHYELPEKSILKLYDEILRRKGNDDVLKAKAILVHGKFYRGHNRKVKNIIDEFNPEIAKTIKAPKTYRKIYTFPIKKNKSGKYVYKFRVQLKIPTEAKFPVYEINIKLPEEVARNASEKRWYDKITLNKTELKNEGRIKIIAPVKSNGYECKISPVQMDAFGGNILEITFSYPMEKVFEISVMAQKPIMRKN